jgi:hypothetical protein
VELHVAQRLNPRQVLADRLGSFGFNQHFRVMRPRAPYNKVQRAASRPPGTGLILL